MGDMVGGARRAWLATVADPPATQALCQSMVTTVTDVQRERF